MVSACRLYLDNVELSAQKAQVPSIFSALFQESDRRGTKNSEDDTDILYQASRMSVLKRLDLMGCTKELFKKSFSTWLETKIQAEKTLQESIYFYDSPILRELNRFTWDNWSRRVPTILRTYNDEEFYKDEINQRMRLGGDSSWLWIDGLDSLISLRGILDAADGFEMVTLDVGELVDGGWIDATEKICLHRPSMVSQRGRPAGPVIILAEGKSDIEVLKATLPVFHPDLTEFISFLDHREFDVDGGAGFVVKFLKAFAAARVPTNIVAVVDNDAAGLVAFEDAKELNFPDNIACIHLPDIELGKNYPTIGPHGEQEMDINGRACSIEIYMGRSSLSENNVLRPVLWNGRQREAWQGSVEDKVTVRTQFLKLIHDDGVNVHRDFPEMALVWFSILEAAKINASAAQERAKPPLDW